MPVLNAWVLPGGSGDRLYFSNVGHFRTGVELTPGVPFAWTMATFARVDSLTPGKDGTIFGLRRLANNGRNHGLRFDDGSNRGAYVYNLGSEQAGTGTDTWPNTTWVLIALTYPGTGTTVTVRLFDLAGNLLGSGTGTASSNYDDGQEQQISYGAEFNGTSTSLEFIGRLCGPLLVRGTALSQSQLAAYAVNPLDAGDALVQSLGSQIAAWFDDTNLNQGPNSATLTMSGAVTLGSGNGPTVPDRAAATGTAPNITTIGYGGIPVVYNGELKVPVIGTDFGTSPPLVQLSADSLGATGLAVQPVRANSDTTLSVDIDLGVLSPGPLYLWVTNQTAGDPSYGLRDSIQIEVRADPGAGVVAVRRASPPTLNLALSVAMAPYNAQHELYARHAQEALVYSVAAGALPTGLSYNSSTGVISGTIDAGAASGSPWSFTLRATDTNGDYAEVPGSWVITSVTATTKLPGTWGRRNVPQLTRR